MSLLRLPDDTSAKEMVRLLPEPGVKLETTIVSPSVSPAVISV